MENPRILFIAEGQLGDLLILTPALRSVKTTFPDSLLVVLVVQRRRYAAVPAANASKIVDRPHAGTAAVLIDNPHVDEVLELDRSALRALKGLVRIKAEWRIVKLLRSKKFDRVVCTFPQDRFVLWALLSGAKARIGQRQQSLSWLLTKKPEIHKETSGVLRYYCELAVAAGAAVMSFDTEYCVPRAAREWAEEFLRDHGLADASRLVAIHPGASGPSSMWPPERFAAIADIIQSESAARVLVCGTDYDENVIQAMKEAMQTQVIQVNSGDNLARFAAILRRCSLCISNDSGPRHLAIAVGTPAIAFMRRGQDGAWKIYEREEISIVLQSDENCHECRNGSCHDRIPSGERFGAHCMRMISVECAAQAVKRHLSMAISESS